MKVAVLMWCDTFEDWFDGLGVTRASWLDGWTAEWVVPFATALRQADVEVHLVHGTLAQSGSGRQSPSGAEAHFVRASPAYRLLREAVWGHRFWEQTATLWSAAPVASTLSPSLLGTLVGLRPDVVVVQDYESLRYDVAAPALRVLGVPVVGLDTGGSAAPSTSAWKPVTRRLARRLLAAHGQEAARLRSCGHGDVDVWPVPIDTAIFTPGDRVAARAALGAPEGALVVTAARLHPVKDLGLLADACRDVGATLAIAGEGSERDALSGRALLLGQLPAAEVARWYAAADVVGLSSLREGQPVAVLEALACGRAVVATAVGGVPDVVVPGETGWLVPAGDLPAFTQALRAALGDPQETDRRGAAGAERVRRDHAYGVAGARLREQLSP